MNKFKNNILFKNIVILLLTGIFAKIIGMFSKIIFTRKAGIEIVSLYALITPTLMLIIGIVQFSFPISISKLSAENKYNNKTLLKNAYFIGMIVDAIIIVIVLLTNNKIASLLNNKNLNSVIISIIFIIPFITISSIQRGFLHGKEDMLCPSLLNISEELIKILLIYFFIPYVIYINKITAVIFLIIINLFTEISSILVMKNKINKKYFSNKKAYINKFVIKDILNISVSTTLIRLISSVGFFLEPIILTNLLIYKGFSSSFVTIEYGIINSYVIPLLQFPSFFTIAISSALLPNITKLYKENKLKQFKDKLYKLLLLSVLIGISFVIVVLLFPSFILNLIYKVNYGTNYIYFLAPVFILLYIQPPLTSAVQAMGKTKKLLKISIISITIKYLSLTIFCMLDMKMTSLLLSIIIGIILTTSMEMIVLYKK